MRRIIFYLPYKINKNRASASQIRPLKMLNAFRENGYEVDQIVGFSSDRKMSQKKILHKLKNGEHYDFAYCESCTFPSMLTDKHHLPLYPLFDFSFFRTLNKYKVPSGVFFRDVYWRFELFRTEYNLLQRLYLRPFYNLDVMLYRKHADVIFLPSMQMLKHLPEFKCKNVLALPPGCEENTRRPKKNKTQKLNLLYVGGVSPRYKLDVIMNVVNGNAKVDLNICTREDEWNLYKNTYPQVEFGNIQVYHYSGEDLKKLYSRSDIGVLFFNPNNYQKFCMPYKLFEYLGNRLPVIAVKGTSAGDFVEKHKVGWTVEYSSCALSTKIVSITSEVNAVGKKVLNIDRMLPKNTWNARAITVINVLKGIQ